MMLQLAGRLKSLRESVNQFGADHNFTRLVPDLSGGIDPDDAFSTVPYVKGMSLFCRLESLVGGEEKFQPFLKAYFAKFGGVTVTSEQMKDYFLEYFQEKASEDPAVKEALEGPLAALDWKSIWGSPGMPDWIPEVDPKPSEDATALAERWNKAGSDAEALAAFSAKDIEGWGTTKLIVFLDLLLKDSESGGGEISAEACARMAELYKLLTSNCELRFRFLRLALGAKWDGAKEAAVDLSTSQGRMKFTRPMYRALKSYDIALAKDTFAKHKASYHPICVKMVSRDLEA